MFLKRVCAAAILATACGPPCGDDHARVAAVLDGDTIVLADERIVRITAIDAPELSRTPPECGAIEARDALAAMVLGRDIRLIGSASGCTDRYGRTVARILADGSDAGLRLVADGLACAWPDIDEAPDRLARAETQARDGRIGNWSRCPAFCSRH